MVESHMRKTVASEGRGGVDGAGRHSDFDAIGGHCVFHVLVLKGKDVFTLCKNTSCS